MLHFLLFLHLHGRLLRLCRIGLDIDDKTAFRVFVVCILIG